MTYILSLETTPPPREKRERIPQSSRLTSAYTLGSLDFVNLRKTRATLEEEILIEDLHQFLPSTKGLLRVRKNKPFPFKLLLVSALSQ